MRFFFLTSWDRADEIELNLNMGLRLTNEKLREKELTRRNM